MRLQSFLYGLTFASVAQAHFSLNYPSPWGEFNEDNQKTFCDGYKNASTRSVFPLKEGTINLLSTHTNWTVGVILTTVPNPTSFDNFTVSGRQQFVVPFSQQSGAGNFCIPIDIASSGITGVQDGKTVTIQIVYDGGDGSLYQCADLTLSSSMTVPTNQKSNCTTVKSSSSSPSSASGTATPSSGTTGGALYQRPTSLLPIAVVLTLSGMIAVAL